MLITTRAIILGAVRTAGDKLVVRTLTEEAGRVDFIVYGAWSKRSGHKASYIFPLSAVDVTWDYRPNKELPTLKEATPSYPLIDLFIQPEKSTIAMFLAEIFVRSIHKGEETQEIFDYCWQTVASLEHTQRNIANFHIATLVGLSRLLGIQPNAEKHQKNVYFDLSTSQYEYNMPLHAFYLNHQQTAFLPTLLRINYRNMRFYRLDRTERQFLLETIITYFKLHIPEFGDVKSLKTLMEVYNLL